MSLLWLGRINRRSTFASSQNETGVFFNKLPHFYILLCRVVDF